ncbi:unnamed protein product, partial [Mesorhabditis spiculigera]
MWESLHLGPYDQTRFDLIESYNPLATAGVAKGVDFAKIQIPRRPRVKANGVRNILNTGSDDSDLLGNAVEQLETGENAPAAENGVVLGEYLEWGSWSACKDGERVRMRVCVSRRAARNIRCEGPSKESQACFSTDETNIPVMTDPWMIEREISGQKMKASGLAEIFEEAHIAFLWEILSCSILCSSKMKHLILAAAIIGSLQAATSRADVFEGETVRFVPAGNVFERESVMGNETITKCKKDESDGENCGKWVVKENGTLPIDEVGSETVWEGDELVISNVQLADAGTYHDPAGAKDPNGSSESASSEGSSEDGDEDKSNTIVTLIVHSGGDME